VPLRSSDPYDPAFGTLDGSSDRSTIPDGPADGPAEVALAPGEVDDEGARRTHLYIVGGMVVATLLLTGLGVAVLGAGATDLLVTAAVLLVAVVGLFVRLARAAGG